MGMRARLATGAAIALALVPVLAGTAAADDVIVADQGSAVTNSGTATADTGGNDAEGNDSDNDIDITQTGGGGDVNVNFADASNTSDGSATIETGDATAVGNVADTDIAQTIAVPDDGDDDVVVVSQVSAVSNTGAATAETGDNDADGNDSDNDVDITQTGDVNFADASNTSDGSVSIRTGDACAVGNLSSTVVTQSFGGTTTAIGTADVPPNPCRDVPPPPPGKPGPGGGHHVMHPHHAPPATGGAPAAAVPGQLARTGGDVTELALAGFGLVLAGSALRRRRR